MNERIAVAAARLSVPRAAVADSFVLHASLELMARVGLLAYADPADHDRMLDAIDDLADRYEAWGEPAPTPAAVDMSSAEALDACVRAGDVDGADAALLWLAAHHDPTELRHELAPAVVDALGAAGHTPIGLHLLAAVDPPLPPTLLRGALRDLAGEGEWRIHWLRDEQAAAGSSLEDALRAAPHLGSPGSDFIYPLMRQADESGWAARLIGPHLDAPDAGRTVIRAAAWSMLHDDAAHAPYGWTHSLTLPQAVLRLAGKGIDQRTAVAVAGTFLLGFRLAHGTVPLGSLDDAATAPIEPRPVAQLAAEAGCHLDAHLVKYTLACFHAAEDDPAWRAVYLAAATYLADWWRTAC